MAAAAPAMPVALNATGEPVAPDTVALAACAPAVWPSVQVPVAMPDASVTALAGATDPPAAALQTTVVPLCGAPSLVTTTRSGFARAVPTTALWASPLAVAV